MQNNSPKILAIDPSLSCTGYSIIEVDTEEVKEWGKITTKTGEQLINRSNIIARLLHDSAQNNNVCAVIYEDGFIGKGIKSGIDLSYLRGFIGATFKIYSPQIAIATMQPSEIRKWLGLKGNAKKEDVYNYILESYRESGIIEKIGEFSDKQNSKKTSDIYDSIGIGVAYCRYLKSKC